MSDPADEPDAQSPETEAQAPEVSSAETLGPEAHARPRPPIVALAKLLVWAFFREVEVVGAERVPREGGLVFAANHTNALVDGALLFAALPRPPRFLGKSTLWEIAILRPLLALAAVIPVYRRQDPGVDPAKNRETFARSHEVLASGGAIAIFPEGTSHNQPALVPLKTGISRIVLEAEARFGGLGTRILPVGLTFEEKGRFRSRALVMIGRAIDPGAELERYRRAPREAVQALTDEVRAALHEVTLNYASWREARLIERAAELWARPRPELPEILSLEERFALSRGFIAGYRELAARAPERVLAVERAVEDYDELLELYRLRDVQVGASYPPGRVWRFVSKSLGLLLVRLPLAVLGTITHLPPYFGADLMARRGESPDVESTYKILAAMVFYPLAWLGWAAVAGWLGGWPAALVALVLVPVSGLVALRFHERQSYFLREVRAFFLLRSGPRAMDELRRRRDAVLAGVQGLVADYREALAGSSRQPSTSKPSAQ